MKKKLLFSALCLLLSYLVYEYRPVLVRICGNTPEESFAISMPYADKRRLESFFRYHCLVENWIYTLAGAKPVTFSCIHKPFTSELFFWYDPLTWVSWYEGEARTREWKTWRRYQHYFLKSRFHIFESCDPQWKNSIALVLVDSYQLDRALREWKQDFQRILQKDRIDANELLLEAQTRPFLSEVLKNHDALIGIILGFGRENAWAFFNNDHKKAPLSSVWGEELMQEMLTKQNGKGIFDPWDLDHLYFPGFGADLSSDETIRLKRIYQETRNQIVRYYSGRDFLEATLSLLAECPLDGGCSGEIEMGEQQIVAQASSDYFWMQGRSFPKNKQIRSIFWMGSQQLQYHVR